MARGLAKLNLGLSDDDEPPPAARRGGMGRTRTTPARDESVNELLGGRDSATMFGEAPRRRQSAASNFFGGGGGGGDPLDMLASRMGGGGSRSQMPSPQVEEDEDDAEFERLMAEQMGVAGFGDPPPGGGGGGGPRRNARGTPPQQSSHQLPARPPAAGPWTRPAPANPGRGGGGASRGRRGGVGRDTPAHPPVASATACGPAPLSPLYKTRMCNFFVVGACRAGPLCGFAHGDAELRPSPNFERTSICPTMLRSGACNKAGCRYAHRSVDLKSSPVMLKTKLCSFHFEGGGCIVGEACRFAHTAGELMEASVVQQEALLRLSHSTRGTAQASSPEGDQNESSSVANAAAEGLARRQSRLSGSARLRGLQQFVGQAPDGSEVHESVGEVAAAAANAANAVARAAAKAAAFDSTLPIIPHSTKERKPREPTPPPGLNQSMGGARVGGGGGGVVGASGSGAGNGKGGLGAGWQDEEPAAEPAPASDENSDIEELDDPITTAVGDRVVVVLMAAGDWSRVATEDIAWKTCASSSLLGVGGAVALRTRPTSGVIAQLASGMKAKVLWKVKAVLDIEDMGRLTRVCGKCTSGSGSRPACFVAAAALGHGSERRSLVAGACSSSGAFPECLMCIKGGARQHGPCAGCDHGLRLVTKKTFLEIEEEPEDALDTRHQGSRRRSLSH
mmetsp:Transcript_3926/g.13117  ORF Transcript_3926/g.13117 Transcript_3926/m.13117 type:complete len:678 (+) Transcript_3926:106-2139(+)